MDAQEFRNSLSRKSVPPELSPVLRALWLARKGDWNGAHEVVQELEDNMAAAWVHAYLHRVEGDLSNAAYWYRRAGRQVAKVSLEKEWEALVAGFLEQRDQ